MRSCNRTRPGPIPQVSKCRPSASMEAVHLGLGQEDIPLATGRGRPRRIRTPEEKTPQRSGHDAASLALPLAKPQTPCRRLTEGEPLLSDQLAEEEWTDGPRPMQPQAWIATLGAPVEDQQLTD